MSGNEWFWWSTGLSKWLWRREKGKKGRSREVREWREGICSTGRISMDGRAESREVEQRSSTGAGAGRGRGIVAQVVKLLGPGRAWVLE